jgi:branched-chain amino acid transport system substrate-binding protein
MRTLLMPAAKSRFGLRPPRRRRAVWALTASLATGCTFLVDRDADQCKRDSDCEKKGRAFEGLVCTRDRVCGRESCAVHSDCTSHYDRGAYCRPDGSCGDLFAESACTDLLPQEVLNEDGGLRDLDLLLMGFMAPLEGDTYGVSLEQGAALALKEMARYNVRPQQLAMLVCDEGGDVAERNREVAAHLIDELQVPAILGPGYSGATRAVAGATGVTQAAGVLTLSASATSPDFEKWQDADLFFRTVPSDSVQAPAVAELTLAIESELQKQGVLAPEQRAAVALVWRDNTWGTGMQAEVDAALRARGVAAFYAKYPEREPDFEALAKTLAREAPHIVVGLGNGEFVELMRELEEASSELPPRYVLPESVRLPELEALVEEQRALSGRILGTAPGGRQSERYLGFRGRFQGEYGKSTEPGNLAEFAYDAAYMLSFAALRSLESAPTGRELARALSELSCKDGGAVLVEASEYVVGAQLVEDESCVDFVGASGDVDFNGRGETSSDMQIWCPLWDRSAVDLDMAPGIYYDVKTKRLKGALLFCP